MEGPGKGVFSAITWPGRQFLQDLARFPRARAAGKGKQLTKGALSDRGLPWAPGRSAPGGTGHRRGAAPRPSRPSGGVGGPSLASGCSAPILMHPGLPGIAGSSGQREILAGGGPDLARWRPAWTRAPSTCVGVYSPLSLAFSLGCSFCRHILCPNPGTCAPCLFKA